MAQARHAGLGIITALTEEFRIVLKLLAPNGYSHTVDSSTATVFYHFTLPAQRTSVDVVAVCVGAMSPTQTAIITQLLYQRWAPETIILAGLGGALSRDLNLGDVVVGSYVDAYLDDAKAVPSAGKGFDFKLAGQPFPLSRELPAAVRNWEFTNPTQHRAWLRVCEEMARSLLSTEDRSTDFNDRSGIGEPKVVEGSVASGPVVGAATAFSEWLLARNRKYAVLEMEAAGAAAGAELQQCNVMVLRGISDFADERKQQLDSSSAGAIRQLAMHNTCALIRSLALSNIFNTAVKYPIERFQGPVAEAGETILIGRDVELQGIFQHLADNRGWPLGLIGPGGVGKSTLLAHALGLARQLGLSAYYADFGPARSEQDLIGILWRNTGASLEVLKVSAAELGLVHRGRSSVFVLDHLEHVTPAAQRVLAEILTMAPDLRVIYGSQEPLGLIGEELRRLSPLSVPSEAADSLTIENSAAVLAMLHYWGRPAGKLAKDEAHLLAKLAALTDGLPLMLELIGYQLRSRQLEELLSAAVEPGWLGSIKNPAPRLPRHLTMRDMVSLTTQNLSDTSSKVFRAAALGRTSLDAEALAYITSLDLEVVDRELSLLAHKSLLQTDKSVDGFRARLLGPIKSVVLQELTETAAFATMRERHREFFINVALEAGQHLISDAQVTWLEVVGTEYGNIHDAIEAACDAGDPRAAAAAGALARFWFTRGFILEGLKLSAKIAATLPHVVDLSFLTCHALLAWYNGDFGAARQSLITVMDVAERTGEDWYLNNAKANLGLVASAEQHYEEARAWYEAARDRSAQTHDQWNEAIALAGLASVASRNGLIDEAQRFYFQSIDKFRLTGDLWSVGRILRSILMLLVNRAEVDDAGFDQLYAEAQEVCAALSDAYGRAKLLEIRGHRNSAHHDLHAALVDLLNATLQMEGMGARSQLIGLLLTARCLLNEQHLHSECGILAGATDWVRQRVPQSEVADPDCEDRSRLDYQAGRSAGFRLGLSASVETVLKSLSA